MTAKDKQFFQSFFESLSLLRNNHTEGYFKLNFDGIYVFKSREQAISDFLKRVNFLEPGEFKDRLLKELGDQKSAEPGKFLQYLYANRFRPLYVELLKKDEKREEFPTPSGKGIQETVTPFRNLTLNLVSKAQISVHKFIAHHPVIGSSLALGALGAAIGAASGFSAGGLAAVIPAALAWGGGAAMIPPAIQANIPQKIIQAAQGGVDIANNLLSPNSSSEEEELDSASSGVNPSSRLSGFSSLKPFMNLRLILIILSILFFASLFIAITGGLGGKKPTESTTDNVEKNFVDLSKAGPDSIADNSKEIIYRLTATFKGKGLANFKVTDTLPENTKFVNASSNPSGNISCQTSFEGKPSGQIVTWELTGINPDSPVDLCLTIKSDQNDVWLVNRAKADLGSVVGGESKPLEVKVTGPTRVNSTLDQIKYQIIATYNGSGTAKIVISNPIPQNSEFISGSQQEGCESQSEPTDKESVVKWGPFELTQGKSAKVCLTIKSALDKIKLIEIAKAQIIDLVIPAPNVSAADFDSLMKGQGRNTDVLGSEDNFVETVMKNGKNNLSGKEPQVHQIYQTSVAKNVNPMIVLTIWGVEQTFQIGTREFGCPTSYAGFSSQLACSVKTLDDQMKIFKQNAKNGSVIYPSSSCAYNDEFLYAYEAYTPVCHIYDKNETSRKNFVDYYKKLARG